MGYGEPTNFSDVGAFHEKFDLDNVTFRGPGPREYEEGLLTFRVDFMREEIKEFVNAWSEDDDAGMFDALLDLVYVVLGTAHLLGLPWEEGWDAVHLANLKKVRAKPDGSDSKRGTKWDVVKPEGWEPPDIAAVLRRHGFSV